jgi:hypothetical protein
VPAVLGRWGGALFLIVQFDPTGAKDSFLCRAVVGAVSYGRRAAGNLLRRFSCLACRPFHLPSQDFAGLHRLYILGSLNARAEKNHSVKSSSINSFVNFKITSQSEAP